MPWSRRFIMASEGGVYRLSSSSAPGYWKARSGEGMKRPRSLSKTFQGTVFEILGTAQSTGCRVEGEDPHDIIDQIKEGAITTPEE